MAVESTLETARHVDDLAGGAGLGDHDANLPELEADGSRVLPHIEGRVGRCKYWMPGEGKGAPAVAELADRSSPVGRPRVVPQRVAEGDFL